MRKNLLVIFLLSITVTLYASEIYKSNELGQKLELESSVGQEGYFLEIAGNTHTLYLNGSVYCITTTVVSDNVKTISKNYTSGVFESYKYENGLLKSYSSNDLSVIYNYINNKLYFCIVNEKEIFFLRSASDGTLIAIKHDDEIELISDSYLYEKGSFYNIASNNLVFTGNYEVQDDGSFIFTDGEKTYHYSALGLLLSITSESETVTYSYKDNIVVSITTTKNDGSYIISNYEDGVLVKVNEYDNTGVITFSTDYSAGKMVRTVYKDGRAVADIFYKDDNVTVDSIKYR